MIVTFRFPVRIDKELGKILPLSFIREECRACDQAISAVRANHLPLLSPDHPGHTIPAQFNYMERVIVIDILDDIEYRWIGLQRRFPGLPLDQAWRAIFLHEVGHAVNGSWSEHECDRYARERLMTGG